MEKLMMFCVIFMQKYRQFLSFHNNNFNGFDSLKHHCFAQMCNWFPAFLELFSLAKQSKTNCFVSKM